MQKIPRRIKGKKYQTNEDDFGHGIGQATLKYGIKDYTIWYLKYSFQNNLNFFKTHFKEGLPVSSLSPSMNTIFYALPKNNLCEKLLNSSEASTH